MTNTWPAPHDRHGHIPPSSGASSQSGQWQAATQPDANTTNQVCSCSRCSVTRQNDPPVWRTDQQQSPWIPGDAAFPNVNQNQGFDNPMEIAATLGNAQIQQQPVASRAPNHQNIGHVPLHDEAQLAQAQTNLGLDQIPVWDMTATESLRRLAARFVNNPESIVNLVRLEPGASGQFRVVVIMEVAGVP